MAARSVVYIPAGGGFRHGAALLALTLALGLSACAPKGPQGRRPGAGPAGAEGAEAAPVVPLSVEARQRFDEAAALLAAPPGGQDPARAESLLKEALAKEPRLAEAQFDLGVLYESQGKRKEAVAAYERTLEIDPRYLNALVNLGNLSLRAGKRKAAVAAFEKAIEIDPFSSFARNNLANIYREEAVGLREDGNQEAANKSFAKAVAHVRKVLAADPQNLEAYNNLVLIYYDLGKFDLARLVAVSAMKFKKPNAPLHNHLGLVLLALKRVTAATKSFEASLAVDPNYVPARLNLGAISLNYRDFKGAYEQFAAAVKEMDDPSADVLLSYGVAARGLGKNEEAEALYRRVLEQSPDSYAAYYNLGVLYQEHWNKPNLALEAFRSYLRVAPDKEGARLENVRSRVKGLQELQQLMEEQARLAREAPKGPPPEAEDEGAPPEDEGTPPADGAAPEPAEGAAPGAAEAAPAAAEAGPGAAAAPGEPAPAATGGAAPATDEPTFDPAEDPGE